MSRRDGHGVPGAAGRADDRAGLLAHRADGLGEIITPLLVNGLTLTAFTEQDSTPWNALPGQMTKDESTGEWRLSTEPDRLAATYTLQAVKPL